MPDMQHNSNVIPGKLAIASATRNPGIFVGARGMRPLDTGLRRYDGKSQSGFPLKACGNDDDMGKPQFSRSIELPVSTTANHP